MIVFHFKYSTSTSWYQKAYRDNNFCGRIFRSFNLNFFFFEEMSEQLLKEKKTIGGEIWHAVWMHLCIACCTTVIHHRVILMTNYFWLIKNRDRFLLQMLIKHTVRKLKAKSLERFSINRYTSVRHWFHGAQKQHSASFMLCVTLCLRFRCFRIWFRVRFVVYLCIQHGLSAPRDVCCRRVFVYAVHAFPFKHMNTMETRLAASFIWWACVCWCLYVGANHCWFTFTYINFYYFLLFSFVLSAFISISCNMKLLLWVAEVHR